MIDENAKTEDNTTPVPTVKETNPLFAYVGPKLPNASLTYSTIPSLVFIVR
jgi:hypothetical protein